jgi:hypothetical protein
MPDNADFPERIEAQSEPGDWILGELRVEMVDLARNETLTLFLADLRGVVVPGPSRIVVKLGLRHD